MKRLLERMQMGVAVVQPFPFQPTDSTCILILFHDVMVVVYPACPLFSCQEHLSTNEMFPLGLW